MEKTKHGNYYFNQQLVIFSFLFQYGYNFLRSLKNMENLDAHQDEHKGKPQNVI